MAKQVDPAAVEGAVPDSAVAAREGGLAGRSGAGRSRDARFA